MCKDAGPGEPARLRPTATRYGFVHVPGGSYAARPRGRDARPARAPATGARPPTGPRRADGAGGAVGRRAAPARSGVRFGGARPVRDGGGRNFPGRTARVRGGFAPLGEHPARHRTAHRHRPPDRGARLGPEAFRHSPPCSAHSIIVTGTRRPSRPTTYALIDDPNAHPP